MNIQEKIAMNGRSHGQFDQFANTNERRIPERAPATQNILYLLDANIAANIHHQIHVKSPCKGEAPEATASEIDKGIFIIATESQAFQLFFRLKETLFNILINLKNKGSQNRLFL